MPLKNRYYKCSKISERKFRQIIRYFAQDLTASDTSRLTSISIRGINNIYLKLRKRIIQECEQQAPFNGVVEVDESYFGDRHKGKRGLGVVGKVPVFGILKRQGRVYTKIVPDVKSATLISILEQKVIPDSIVYTDSWHSYNVLDVSDFHHVRINHSKLFAKGRSHI